MTRQEDDPLDFIGAATCPNCLTPMVDTAAEDDARDAHWRCPACGLVSITG